MKELKANGLKLFSIKSKPKHIDRKIDNIIETCIEWVTTPANIILYLDYEVRIGTFTAGQFAFYEEDISEEDKFDLKTMQKFVQRLRLFNEQEELLIWRSGVDFYGRFRRDGEGNPTEVVEAYQVLFGTKKENYGNYTRINEDRGTALILPDEWEVDEKKKRVAILTRNYIGYTGEENHPTSPPLATYVDCRFIKFDYHPIENI